MRSVLAAVIAFFALPNLAAAQVWPALDRAPTVQQLGAADVAVLVAVEDYLFVPDIEGARANLVEWETFLRDGLGVKTVTTLVNEQATREEILAAVESGAGAATETSTVWFVFIGHGAPAADGQDGMLIGADAQQTPRSVAARGVTRTELVDRLARGAQKRTVLLFDACFSGQTPSGEAIVPAVQPMIPLADNFALPEGMVLMTAARSNEFAGTLAGTHRPAFSYLVLGGLRGWADDGDGTVTADEAVVFARRELLAAPGRRQTPQLLGAAGTVLSMNATEPRPGSRSADVGPMVTAPEVSVAQVPPSAREVDRPPSRSFLRLAAGMGGELTYETTTPIVDVAWGFRLSDPARRSVWSLVSGLHFGMAENPTVHATNSALASVLQTLREAGVFIDDFRAEPTSLLQLGLGPAVAVDLTALKLSAELRGAVAMPLGGECRSYTFDEFGNTECSDRRSAFAPAVNARVGLGWRAVELALHADFIQRPYSTPVQVINAATGEDTYEMRDESELAVILGATLGVRFDL